MISQQTSGAFMFHEWEISQLQTVSCSADRSQIITTQLLISQKTSTSIWTSIFRFLGKGAGCRIGAHSVCVRFGDENRAGCWSEIAWFCCRLWCAADRAALGSVCQRVKPLCAAVWSELFRVPHCYRPVMVTETDWHTVALRGRSLQSASLFHPSIHVSLIQPPTFSHLLPFASLLFLDPRYFVISAMELRLSSSNCLNIKCICECVCVYTVSSAFWCTVGGKLIA